jgi:hypothetical protein
MKLQWLLLLQGLCTFKAKKLRRHQTLLLTSV